MFRMAGQKVEDNNVRFGPDFLLEQAAPAPRAFDVQARNPANNVHIGGENVVFGGVHGPPFVREGHRGAGGRDRTQEARGPRAAPLDDAVREELAEHVVRRRKELGHCERE